MQISRKLLEFIRLSIYTQRAAGFSVFPADQQTTKEGEKYENMDKLLENTSEKIYDTENTKTNKETKIKNSKNRRGKRKKNELELCIMSTNAAQLQGKLNSFKGELKYSNVGLFTVQETHYSSKGKVKIEGYEIFEAIRKKDKGGTMIGAHKGLKPILISEYNDEFELLVIEIKIGIKEIRIMSGYGPQESWPEQQRIPFFMALEEEIVKAELAGKSIFIEMDANSKLGNTLIPGDMHKQSDNGKILAGILERHSLMLGNNMDVCQGLITRQRITKHTIEKSIIDFVIISEDLKKDVKAIIIDDERKHVLTRMTKTKKGVVKVESDHNIIFTKLRMQWDKKISNQRQELFNLKNEECQKAFREATETENNNGYLSSVFDEEGDINIVTEKFMKRLQKTIFKCFKKVRIKERVDIKKEEMFRKWREMKNNVDDMKKVEFEEIENQLATKYSEEFFERIKEETNDVDCEDGGISAGKLWSLKKKIFPKSRDPPTAMVDPKSGNLLTTEEKIEEAALNVYKERLRNRPMNKNIEHIKDAKEMLCKKLLELAKCNKTPAWTIKDLNLVLKNLKKQKSRDPYGLANDLFRPEVAGSDLKLALLKLMNKIKDDQEYPRNLELCNISSIWKSKGSRSSFDSYRGIFRVTIFRSILERLIYNDEYKNLDKNLTDSNVGARKNRNIRDNIFVLNAIVNSVKKETDNGIDCQIYDIEKCFDALWLHEVINSLFEAGLQNDKLPLLFLENNNAQVAVKTNERISKRVSIQNIIMQGSIFGSLCCVVMMDKLGKVVYKERPELLFYYKGLVGTPPLQMVDDILGIQQCSSKSLQLNSVINTFIDLEKLRLSSKKCSNVHIGKGKHECHTLKVHGQVMRNRNQETYLGDVIDKSGKARINIEKRKAKGFGIVANILAIINEIPLAHWKIEAGLRLRQAMLVNGILYNSEAWQGIEEKDIILLEKIDEALLRGILKAHPKIPLEALYLETKSVPIRFIVASRRLMYLHTILQKDETEMVKKVYEAQKTNPSPGDFIEIVRKDCENISLDLSEKEIYQISKQKFRIIVKSKILNAAFSFLKNLQEKHSKMKNIEYERFDIVPYLKSPLFNDEKRSLLLALRTRTVRGIRNDFRGLYKSNTCPLECGEIDTIENILTCSVLRNYHRSNEVTTEVIKYEDIFSQDISRQQKVTELYYQLINTRNKIIQSIPVASNTGPVHGQNSTILSG